MPVFFLSRLFNFMKTGSLFLFSDWGCSGAGAGVAGRLGGYRDMGWFQGMYHVEGIPALFFR